MLRSLHWMALAPIALGHLWVLIVIWNLSHALPLRLRQSDRLMLAIGLAWLVVTAALANVMAPLSWQHWPLAVQVYAAFCAGVAVVGLPVSSLLLHRRRPPAGTACRTEVRALASEAEAAQLRGGGLNGWLLRLPRNEWLRLNRSHWRVEMPSLPADSAGLTVVHVSDFHFARCFDRRYFEAVAEAASEWTADLVLFTGDLIDDAACLDWIEPVFARMRGRLGQYAILGNHDYDFDVRAIRSRLGAAGFTDLDGRSTLVHHGGVALMLTGTSAPWGPRLDLPQAPPSDVRIVLSHSPDQFPKLAARGIDLVLAGHNHGGQVRLPGVGPLLMPSRYNRRFDRGCFRSGHTLMHVSQGVAGKHPVRYGCPPEISRLDLVPLPRQDGARPASPRHLAEQTQAALRCSPKAFSHTSRSRAESG